MLPFEASSNDFPSLENSSFVQGGGVVELACCDVRKGRMSKVVKGALS